MAADNLDNTLRILADEERRKMLRVLSETPKNEIPFNEVISKLEYDDEQTRLSLMHHQHIPKMEESGILEYDPERGILEYNPHPELEELAEVLKEYE